MSEPNMSEAIDMGKRRRSRLTLVLIFVIGIVPIASAWIVLYFFPGLIPVNTTNKGVLVKPPIAVDRVSNLARAQLQKGKWALLLPVGSDCDKTCQHGLYLARQVNIALGKDSGRVQRILLVRGSEVSQPFNRLLKTEYPRMVVQYDSSADVAGTLGQYSTSGSL
ncbi:MAG TPA: hypothetical protein VJ998_02255, partial [Pseudomonadales bacterium]|nr:hypothetical protein [Pseudomonadales bacterium]